MRVTKKQSTKKPAPDVKGATREMLARTAAWMRSLEGETVLFGHLGRTFTDEEHAALTEARALAAAYVEKGAAA